MALTHHEWREIYERTQYCVRLQCGGHAVIRIHRALPASLRTGLAEAYTPWAFITAWNPVSRPLSIAVNRSRQRQLLMRLRQLRPLPCITAGVGIGSADDENHPWREPSLFVVGIELERVDALMRAFDQNAVVCGTRDKPASLRWNPDRQGKRA